MMGPPTLVCWRPRSNSDLHLHLGSSIQEQRYLNTVSVPLELYDHPPQSQISFTDNRISSDRNCAPPRWKEWVPYGLGSTWTSNKFIWKCLRNCCALCLSQQSIIGNGWWRGFQKIKYDEAHHEVSADMASLKDPWKQWVLTTVSDSL